MPNLKASPVDPAEGRSVQPDAVDTVREFIASINGKRVDRLLARMTRDHVFVDSMGGEVRGRHALREPWHRYLALFPDYRIEIESILRQGDVVVIVGTSSGTLAVAGGLHPDNHWSIPTCWRAEVTDGLVSSWRVFADNEPVRAIMKRAGVL